MVTLLQPGLAAHATEQYHAFTNHAQHLREITTDLNSLTAVVDN